MARTVEVGDCMEWTGYFQNKTPFVVSGGDKWMVRRLVKHLEGKPLSEKLHFGTHCNNHKCVKPEHIAERTQKQHMTIMAKKVKHNHPIRIAKLQKAAQFRRVLTDECLAKIRVDERSCAAISIDYAVSKSLIQKIKIGKSNRVVRASLNPFAGLMR